MSKFIVESLSQQWEGKCREIMLPQSTKYDGWFVSCRLDSAFAEVERAVLEWKTGRDITKKVKCGNMLGNKGGTCKCAPEWALQAEVGRLLNSKGKILPYQCM